VTGCCEDSNEPSCSMKGGGLSGPETVIFLRTLLHAIVYLYF